MSESRALGQLSNLSPYLGFACAAWFRGADVGAAPGAAHVGRLFAASPLHETGARPQMPSSIDYKTSLSGVAFFRIVFIRGSHSGGPGHARVKRVFASCRALLKLLRNISDFFNFNPCLEIWIFFYKLSTKFEFGAKTENFYKLWKDIFGTKNHISNTVITCIYSIFMSDNISGHGWKLKNPRCYATVSTNLYTM